MRTANGFRTGIVRRADNVLLIFAYADPQGVLQAVIEADNLDAAWFIATGWDDAAGIAARKADGWRVTPCMVEWQ